MNSQIKKVIDAANKSPKSEITFKIGGVDKTTLESWSNDFLKNRMKISVITLASGDLGLQINKLQDDEEVELSLEEVIAPSMGSRLTHTPSSDAIKLIEWEKNTLYVKFNSGAKTYRFEGVPEYIFHDFAKAHSAGRFFQQNIKGKFGEAS